MLRIEAMRFRGEDIQHALSSKLVYEVVTKRFPPKNTTTTNSKNQKNEKKEESATEAAMQGRTKNTLKKTSKLKNIESIATKFLQYGIMKDCKYIQRRQ